MKQLVLPVIGISLAISAHGEDAPKALEVPPVFAASQRLTPELLQGPHHRVREAAPSDGFLIHYTIDSDFGVFECAGQKMLERRVGEIAAIAKLVAVSRSDLFAKGLAQSIEKPIEAVKNIAKDPEKSIKAVPKTVGHFFSKVGSAVGNSAKRVSKQWNEAGDSGNTGEAVKNTGKGLGQAAKSVAGFDQAKLETARQLGVDPYSDNVRLQEEIEKVTWAFFAGGLPLRIGAMAASGGASAALTATKAVGLPEDIYDLTPSELALRDRESLTAMGVPAATIDQVFLSPQFSVSLRHGIVENLKTLPTGPGSTKVITSALSCERRRQVGFLLETLLMLNERHKQAPYAKLATTGRLPVGITADGTIEAVAPVDFVSWTAQISGFATREDLPKGPRRLILSGGLSPMAATEMKASGWEVMTAR